jgi:glutathione S-transferase
MAVATLTISSRNYSSWSLRGWLLTRMSGLPFDEIVVPITDPDNRAELLLLLPSVLVPRLSHDGATVWDTLAIGEYLHEVRPAAGLLPADRVARAQCRSICGEMHSGFGNLRSALPMNLKAHHPGFKVWAGAQADIDRILHIWRECLHTHGGTFLFGPSPWRPRPPYPIAGGHALPHLRRRSRRGVRRLWPAHRGAARHGRSGRGGAAPARRDRGARRRVLMITSLATLNATEMFYFATGGPRLNSSASWCFQNLAMPVVPWPRVFSLAGMSR